jgi:hypothetical protein
MTLWLLTLRDGWPVYAHRVVSDERRRLPKPVLPVPAPGFVFAEERVTRVRTACGIDTDPWAQGLWEMEDGKLPLRSHAICTKCLPQEEPSGV